MPKFVDKTHTASTNRDKEVLYLKLMAALGAVD